MKLKRTEHDEQCLLIEWWSIFSKSVHVDEDLLFAIPNGGKRNIVIASKLKKEGVRAGIPDLFLAYPRSCFGGLFIEMKIAKGGVVSEAQKKYIQLLRSQGYIVEVCHGFEEAKQCIAQYICG